MVDLRPLAEKVVRKFADDPLSGEVWTRERAAPSTTLPSGSIATALADKFEFRCFVNPLAGRQAVKGEPDGEKQDEVVTLYGCTLQQVNGLAFLIDFVPADDEANKRGDIVRRADGRAYEVIASIPWAAGEFFEISARRVVGG